MTCFHPSKILAASLLAVALPLSSFSRDALDADRRSVSQDGLLIEIELDRGSLERPRLDLVLRVSNLTESYAFLPESPSEYGLKLGLLGEPDFHAFDTAPVATPGLELFPGATHVHRIDLLTREFYLPQWGRLTQVVPIHGLADPILRELKVVGIELEFQLPGGQVVSLPPFGVPVDGSQAYRGVARQKIYEDFWAEVEGQSKAAPRPRFKKPGPKFVPGQLLVTFSQGKSPEEAQDLAQSFGHPVLETLGGTRGVCTLRVAVPLGEEESWRAAYQARAEVSEALRVRVVYLPQ